MNKKKYIDIISSVLLITLGVVYYCAADALPAPLTKEPLGPAGFPKFLAIVLILLSGVILVKAILDKSEEGMKEGKFGATDMRYLLILLIALVLYAAGIKLIGYMVSTFVFCCVCFWLMGAKWDKPLRIIIPSILIAVICYFVFSVLFDADLAGGLLI